MNKNINHKKLDEISKNIKKRSSMPWNNFHKKVEYIEYILRHSSEKISDKAILNEIRKQQLVSLITALEIYLRDTFIILIDDKKINSDDFSSKIKKELSILEIINLYRNLKNKKITKGIILANEFNFQRFGDALDVFGKILNEDILIKLKEQDDSFNKFEKLNMDFKLEIEKIIQLRHEIVHDIEFRKTMSEQKIDSMVEKIHQFAHIFESHLEDYRLNNFS